MTDTNTQDVMRRLTSLAPLLAGSKTEDAIHLLRQCLDIEPFNPIVLIQLGELLRHTPDIVAGVELLRRGLAIQPTNTIGWLSLASALRTLSQPDGAQAAFRSVLDLDPNRIEALNDLGALLMDQSDWAGAISMFRRASELSPTTSGIRMNLARALAQDGRSNEALEIAEEVAAAQTGASSSAAQFVAELKRPATLAELSHSLAGRHYNVKATGSDDETLMEPALNLTAKAGRV